MEQHMKHFKATNVALSTLGSLVISGLVGVSSVQAETNPFSVTELKGGYMQLAEAKCGEAKCGGDKKASSEAKCGEAKCGGDKKAHTEANCGGDKKASTEAKCGEAKCGGDKKAATEAKCGEGKCGK